MTAVDEWLEARVIAGRFMDPAEHVGDGGAEQFQRDAFRLAELVGGLGAKGTWATVTIPGRPQAWHRAGQNKAKGRTFVDPVNAKRRKEIALIVKSRLPSGWSLGGAFRLDFAFEFAFPKSFTKKERELALFTARPDCDNLMKLVKDALKGIAWEDDALVVCGKFQKGYAAEDATHLFIERLL